MNITTQIITYICFIIHRMIKKAFFIVEHLRRCMKDVATLFLIIGDTLFAKAFLIRVLGCLIFMCHRDLDLDLDLDLVL